MNSPSNFQMCSKSGILAQKNKRKLICIWRHNLKTICPISKILSPIPRKKSLVPYIFFFNFGVRDYTNSILRYFSNSDKHKTWTCIDFTQLGSTWLIEKKPIKSDVLQWTTLPIGNNSMVCSVIWIKTYAIEFSECFHPNCTKHFLL